MEVVVTAGAIYRAKLQSNRHHQQIYTQLFTGRMPFLSPNQQCQSTEGKNHISQTCSTQARFRSSNFASNNGSWLPLISPLIPVPLCTKYTVMLKMETSSAGVSMVVCGNSWMLHIVWEREFQIIWSATEKNVAAVHKGVKFINGLGIVGVGGSMLWSMVDRLDSELICWHTGAVLWHQFEYCCCCCCCCRPDYLPYLPTLTRTIRTMTCKNCM